MQKFFPHPGSRSGEGNPARWRNLGRWLVTAFAALALTACPAQKNSTTEADLRAEVARLKAAAEADEKAKTAAETAKAQAEAARAQQAQRDAERAAADAAAQAKADAEIAAAQAAFDKAQAEADDAAKVAAGVQEEFKTAEEEYEKALAEAEEARKRAEESLKAAEEDDPSLDEVADAKMYADRAAAQAAQAEAARLKKELARARANAAAQKIRAPISQGILDVLRALFTPVNNNTGGLVYSLNSNGSMMVRPNSLSSSATPLLMNAVTWNVPAPAGSLVMATAQLQPSPQFFNPPLEVYFDLQQPGKYPGEQILVMLVDPNNPPNLIPYTPTTWATVTNNLSIAMAKMPHFSTVALITPPAGDPNVPPKGPLIDPPPTKQEAIEKEKEEEAARTAELKQATANLQAKAESAQVRFVDRAKQEEAAEAEKKAQEIAEQKAKAKAQAKARAERKAAEAEARRNAKKLADQKARDRARQKARERERDQQAAEVIGGILEALGGNDDAPPRPANEDE